MKICLIINRASRRGCQKRLMKRIFRELSVEGFDFTVAATGTLEEVESVIAEAKQNEVDALVVVGGDGTVSHILPYLVGTDIALGVIPTGTANDLAGYLGIPKDIREACRAVLRGHPRPIDLLCVNGKYFVTAGGIGVVADTGIGVNRWKAKRGLVLRTIHFFGSLVYVLYSFCLLAFARSIVTEAEVVLDGDSLGLKRYIALFVHNQPSLGKVVMPCPNANSEDGLLDSCLMGEGSGFKRLGAIFTVMLMSRKGAHAQRSEIRALRGKRMEIRCTEEKTFMADGEPLTTSKVFVIENLPGALKVLGPAGTWQEKTVPQRESQTTPR